MTRKSKTIPDDVTLTLHDITLVTFYISFEISCPCSKINSRARLYNAAASPASRLCSAGSLAIIIIIINNYNNNNHRVYQKEGEKIEKYQDLKREIGKLWGIKQ